MMSIVSFLNHTDLKTFTCSLKSVLLFTHLDWYNVFETVCVELFKANIFDMRHLCSVHTIEQRHFNHETKNKKVLTNVLSYLRCPFYSTNNKCVCFCGQECYPITPVCIIQRQHSSWQHSPGITMVTECQYRQ